MTPSVSSRGQASPPGWELLGEIEATTSEASISAVSPWLVAVLSRLEPRAEFMSRLQESAREALVRASQGSGKPALDPFRVRVYLPARMLADCNCWGFFRIEKVEHDGARAARIHAIELYLYLERG